MIDTGPVHVRGAIRARYARVIWVDGVLYVAHNTTRGVATQSIASSEPVRPRLANGNWRAETDAGLVSFSSKSCGG